MDSTDKDAAARRDFTRRAARQQIISATLQLELEKDMAMSKMEYDLADDDEGNHPTY